ncbi:MAG: hypothetical protein JST92_26310, partial [Deltaproteobacteria bacterium]|nr:hypothetical protein [Deltaproteobacteria bacterium]
MQDQKARPTLLGLAVRARDELRFGLALARTVRPLMAKKLDLRFLPAALGGRELADDDTRPSRFSAPIDETVTFETTNICNADCIFCGYQYQKRPHGTQTLEEFKALARLVRENSPKSRIANLTPIVGDPLVDKAILEKIRFCKEIGFST